ncbi:hypothetical protein CQW32_00390 [Pseudomonas putida]|nr:hypothetical protein PPUTLS46_009754 [Pseudomonas putida LS46]PJX12107.1 hypothetical protein CQW32_00390 [Pseudomonas putida]
MGFSYMGGQALSGSLPARYSCRLDLRAMKNETLAVIAAGTDSIRLLVPPLLGAENNAAVVHFPDRQKD